MNRELKRGKVEDSDVKEKVLVAVKASKEIPKTALVWALTHVVHPGDCITLLVVIPSQSSGNSISLSLSSSTVRLSGPAYAHSVWSKAGYPRLD